MAPWLRLLGAVPQWLAAPTAPPPALAGVARLATAWKRQALLRAAALCAFLAAAVLGGTSVLIGVLAGELLPAGLGTTALLALWGVPLPALAAGLVCLMLAARRPAVPEAAVVGAEAEPPAATGGTLATARALLDPVAREHPLALVAGAAVAGMAVAALIGSRGSRGSRPRHAAGSGRTVHTFMAAPPPVRPGLMAGLASAVVGTMVPLLLPTLAAALLRGLQGPEAAAAADEAARSAASKKA